MMFDLFRFTKTNYSAGFLRPSKRFQTADNIKTLDSKFVAPRKIDHRDYCIMSSNQGQTPHCAGYATAGYIEVRNWMTKHYPEQVDGDLIYSKAKELDGDTTDGTSLDSAAEAAIQLNLVSGKIQFLNPTIQDIQFAIHTNIVCVGGFIITNEWNSIDKTKGIIANFGNKAIRLGGHAVLICGYDQEGLYVQNSWGTDWALWGFVKIPWTQALEQFMYGIVIE